MKKYFLIFALLVAFTSTNLDAQIKVNSSGYVGINNLYPSYNLDVVGNLKMTSGSSTIYYNGGSFYNQGGYTALGTYSNYWYELYAQQAYFYYDPIIMSDINLKTNVTTLSEMKGKIKLLRPVSYNLKPNSENPDKTINNLQYGFVAQEVKEIFPDLVIEREDGILGIRYSGLIPILVKAIEEQQEEIDALNDRITALENAVK
ncbi:MAG: hypothetical protein GT600_15190 [Bacteroidales bacterium]|jgi:hypothetical protein|nr:hypothetical protein [Bacteroidales bacterium]NMD03393.1 tail fiber domain-containing protein [Bacteroidales bacterium]OQB59756.1 MAG: hypothetical protein BWX96_02572 [Bacteroidetes bacterium ADurb.Bin145]HQK69433.1 tail fiber domain-containing protein [Bacteroidales bacterium]